MSRPIQIGRVLYWILLVCSCVSITVGQPKASVRIHVTDTYGMAVPADWIKISGPVTTDVDQDLPVNLPYGQYKVQVLVRGFSIAMETVLVSQPSQIVTIGMRPPTLEGQTHPPACSILAQIPANIQANRIRAIELFGPLSLEVPIDGDGQFDLKDIECGDYLLIVLGPSKVMVSPSHLLGVATVRASLSLARVQVTPK